MMMEAWKSLHTVGGLGTSLNIPKVIGEITLLPKEMVASISELF